MRSVDCPRCEELAEEVAYYRRELAQAVGEAGWAAVRSELEIAPRTADILEMLYRAKGRVVAELALREVLATESEYSQAVAVYASKLRRVLGKTAVLNDWGRGYRLSPEAIARIDQILSTQEGGTKDQEQYDRQTNGAKPRADLQAGRASDASVSSAKGRL